MQCQVQVCVAAFQFYYLIKIILHVLLVAFDIKVSNERQHRDVADEVEHFSEKFEASVLARSDLIVKGASRIPIIMLDKITNCICSAKWRAHQKV